MPLSPLRFIDGDQLLGIGRRGGVGVPVSPFVSSMVTKEMRDAFGRLVPVPVSPLRFIDGDRPAQPLA